MRGVGGVCLALGLIVLSNGCAAPGGAQARRDFDLGFIASRDRDVEGNVRTRALGPFFEQRVSESGGQFTAVRPFYARSGNPDRERVLSEFLWPIGMHKTLGKETYWRFLLTYANDFDNTTPGSRYRFVVFPFVFAGRDKHGDGYFAVFPIGGKIHEYLGRDKIVFALFPLYGFSTINDQTRHSVLWPLIGWGGSPDSSHVGVLPFYARSVRDGQWEKRTIAWPFWTDARYHYSGAEGRVHMLWPLYWRGNLETEKTWMFLPPIFRYTRADTLTKVHTPWPFVQYSSGVVDKLYLWPLWGQKSVGAVESWFLFWPVISGGHRPRASGVASHFNLTPLFNYRRVTRMEKVDDDHAAEQEAVAERYVKLWPLFSWHRVDESARFRALELWPGKTLPQLERNWASFWTLYTHDRHGAVHEDEALWGLFRYRRNEEKTLKLSLFPVFNYARSAEDDTRRKWSALLGLIGHERGETRNTFRLLYIPFRY